MTADAETRRIYGEGCLASHQGKPRSDWSSVKPLFLARRSACDTSGRSMKPKYTVRR